MPGVTGFEFEDNEQEVEEEFQRHRKFSLDLVESAGEPDDPESHLGNETEDFYVDSFDVSYGDPQPVQVTAKRELGRVYLHYRINGGREQRSRTREFKGGERYYKDTGVYYHRLRGVVEGTRPGQEVTAWFETANGKRRSSRFTYEAKSESRRRALVVADENYSGPVQIPATDMVGPDYADEAVAALAANGVAADVYDVDANDMTAPHPLGVLGHYDLVIWEKGDDYVTRRPGQPGQTGQARVAIETQLAARDFLNEGGKLMFTGQHAGRQDAEGYEFRNFGFPEPDESATGRWCGGADPETVDGCIPPDNDFQQYYLGAYIYVGGGNAQDADGNPVPIRGEGRAVRRQRVHVQRPGVGRQPGAHGDVRDHQLDPGPGPVPVVRRLAADRDLGASGSRSVRSLQRAVLHVRGGRLGGVQAPAARDRPHRAKRRGSLSFKFSADLEPDWDYMAVEVREVGSENWTTLPAAGVTTQGTGQSCPAGWRDLHPQLDQYQTLTGSDVHAHRQQAGASGTRSPATPRAGRTGRPT